MEELRRWIKENPNTIKCAVIIGMLIIAFLNASCSHKVYDDKEYSYSIDSLVFKSFINNSLLINNTLEVTLNEQGDTIKRNEKCVVAKEKIVYKDKLKYFKITRTKTIRIKTKYVPFWVIGLLLGSLLVNLLFIVKWIKKKGYY